MNLTDSLRKLIKDSEMSRYRISKISGVSESVLSRFMDGEHTITVRNADRILNSLEVSVSFVKGNEDG